MLWDKVSESGDSRESSGSKAAQTQTLAIEPSCGWKKLYIKALHQLKDKQPELDGTLWLAHLWKKN